MVLEICKGDQDCIHGVEVCQVVRKTICYRTAECSDEQIVAICV